MLELRPELEDAVQASHASQEGYADMHAQVAFHPLMLLHNHPPDKGKLATELSHTSVF